MITFLYSYLPEGKTLNIINPDFRYNKIPQYFNN